MDAFICPVAQEIMTDPVSAACGHTFDRSTLQNIEAHRSTHGEWRCPVCREPWHHSFTSAAPTNYALKGAIEAALASGALQRSPSGGIGPGSSVTNSSSAPLPEAPNPNPIEVQVERVAGTDEVLITLTTAANPDTTLPIVAIVALDNSGSMGEPAADPTTQKGSDAVAFNRSDLVRHTWATIPHLLGPKNKASLIIWDNGSEVLLNPTAMTPAGIAAAKRCESRIKPSGGTNIWGGLLAALTVAARTPDENNVIVFQTDGESDPTYNPGRGIIPTFRKWKEDNPRVKVTVNTIGYGYGERLDTVLLREIADVGGGVYSYVPDAGMVGSAVIHQLANLMSAHHRGVQVQIPELGLFVPVGFLQGGQPRTVVLRVPRDASVTVSVRSDTIPEPVMVALTPASPSITAEAAAWPLIHRVFVDELRMAMNRAESEGPIQSLIAHLVADLTLLAPADPKIAALLTDTKGEIFKALAPAAFSRWGRHFLPSVLCGHANQWPSSFKDESSKVFGSAITKALVDKGDTIFNSLPPPKASIAEAQYASARAASVAMGYAPPPPPATTRMASMQSVSSGPCFLGDGLIRMADGTQKRVDQVRAGDHVHGNHRVHCTLKTEVKNAQIVRLGDGVGCGFTEWHPVRFGNTWFHPNQLKEPILTRTDAIYNFVLASGHTLNINGIETCTMAHDFEGPVISHPYFGKRIPGQRHILDDLMKSPGWSEGSIIWRNVKVYYDPKTNYINGMDSD
jgi:hypothetical protein